MIAPELRVYVKSVTEVEIVRFDTVHAIFTINVKLYAAMYDEYLLLLLTTFIVIVCSAI